MPDDQRLPPAQRRLLELLRRGGAAGAPAAVDPGAVTRSDARGVSPLSFAQESVWLIGRLARDVPLFNLVTAAWMPDDVTPAALAARLRACAARHDALRLSVGNGPDGTPLLVVADTVAVELAEMTVEDPVAAALDFAARPYRLDRAPLWRAAVLDGGRRGRLAVLGAHHLALDATSLVLLGAELNGAPLDPVPVRYVDYVAWQRRRLADGELRGDLEYWRERLANLPGPLDVPTDHPRPAVRDLRGATVQRLLPEAVTTRMRAISREERSTTYMTMLAAYLVLLHRWTGERDLLVGSTVSGRTRPELRAMLGMLANMVAIRCSLAGRPTFRDVLRQVRARVLEALDHQDVPFDLVVRELQPGYGRDRPPLAQVAFNMPMQENAALLTQTALPITPRGSQLDLTLHVVPMPAGTLRLELEYAAALFEPATADRLLAQYVAVVDALTTDPDARVGQLPLSGTELSGAGRAVDRPPVLPELLAEQARRSPEAVAVVDRTREVTYTELHARAADLARGLRLRPEEPVGVLLGRGLDAICAMVAVWRAGGCYVPLDPDHPPARLAAIVRDAAIRTVLTRREHADRLAGLELAVRHVEEPVPDGPARPWAAVRPDQAAYVMYTSGSTGRPKGVVVTHGGIANRVLWPLRRLGVGPADRILHKTALTFDAAGWEIFTPLVSGGTVVVAPPAVERDPAAMLRAVADGGVTLLQVVPSVLRQLVAAPGWARCGALRSLFCAGEPLHAELCARVRALADVEIHNTYGPTECSIDITGYRVPTDLVAGAVPIGTPVDGMRVAVLDRDGRPVLRGGVGELYAGGIGVGRGYLGRADLTADRFVPDPSGHPGARLYRTGDLVRLRHDDVLVFVGRADSQVKVNGVRIEPDEVEQALHRHPAVAAAAVVARPLPNGGRQLVAFVTGSESPDPTGLREHLRRTLPDPMVPSAFVLVPELPTTSSGKLDRAAVARLDVPTVTAVAHVEPRDDVERTLAEVWTDLLEVSRVGIDDDFFALGGHSLQMGVLADRLGGVFGVDVPLSALYAATTVRAQAELLADRSGGVHIRRVSRDGPLPLSSGQQRMWFVEQLKPGTAEHLVPVVVSLAPDATPERVAAALEAVTERHEILRTRYPVVGEEPRQVIDPPRRLDLAVTTVDGLDDVVAEHVVDLAAEPFDLAAGPILRGRMLRDATDGTQLLVLVVHHIAWDGASLPVLRADFDQAYHGTPATRPVVQYADYAAWQRTWLDREAVRQVGYWRDRLAGARASELPTDLPRPPVWTGRGRSITFCVPAEVAATVRDRGRAHGATDFMAFLAAFQCLVARRTGTTDTVLGTPVSGRTRRETDALVGYFANVLVLRTDLAGDPTFAQVLDRTREDALAAFTHQDLPFDRLVDEVRPRRDLGRNPLFQIMFELGHTLPSYLPADADPDRLRIPWPSASYDLTVSLMRRPDGGYLGVAEYSTDLFHARTIEALVDEYLGLLRAVSAEPGRRLSELPVAPTTLSDVLHLRAAEQPDAIAVEQGGDRLTYADLAVRVDALADRLAGLGVSAEVPVAVCLPRCPDFVVAVLAVLRAGGVHVPLDPAAPPARQAAMLAATAPAVLVTRAALVAGLPSDTPPMVLVDTAPAEVAPSRDAASVTAPTTGGADAPPRVGARNLAYVVHTSGSTGAPKGVMVEHGTYLAHCRAMLSEYGMTSDDRLLMLCPPFVDVAMEHLGTSLLAGCTLVLAGEQPWSSVELPDRIAAARITMLDIPPIVWRDLLDHLVPGDPRMRGLRLVNVGTDVVYGGDVRRWYDLGLGTPLVASYGPTEAVITTSLHHLSAGTARRLAVDAIVPIGVEVSAAVGHVLDGELYVGGQNLARGYHGQPALTAERFLPDPWGREPGARMYRTGDRVSRRPDGVLEFHGRVDRQVKINSFRVELAEIEACLTGHPDVSAAAVTTVQVDGTVQLAAHVVPARPVDAATLRGHVRGRLPAHMVPVHWNQVPALPLTAAGKPDHAALSRVVVGVDPPPERAGDGPVAAVLDVWRSVLGIGDIDADDDFFDLGGNSLLATRLHTRLQRHFGITLPLRLLLEATTPAQQTAAVVEAVTREVEALTDEEVADLLDGAAPTVEPDPRP